MTDRELLEANYALLGQIHSATQVVYWMCVVGLSTLFVILVLKIVIYLKTTTIVYRVLEVLEQTKHSNEIVNAGKQLAAVTLSEVREKAVQMQETAAEIHKEVKKAADSDKFPRPAVPIDQPVIITSVKKEV